MRRGKGRDEQDAGEEDFFFQEELQLKKFS
jgi:hypothetical protein